MPDGAPARPDGPDRDAGRSLAAALDPIRSVAATPGLRGAVAAFSLFNVAEVASWIAILVFAFGRGGAAEAGLVSVIQLVPAAIVAPLVAGLGDRYPRERMLLLGYVAQGVAMIATGLAILGDAPIPLVYAAAAVAATAVTLTRPAHGAILPALARTPAELTAANVASGTLASVGLLLAPLAAGAVLAIAGPGATFLASAGATIAAAALVAGIRTVANEAVPDREPAREPILAELAGGARVLARRREPRTVVLLLAVGGALEGATDVFIVVLALDLLALGEAGVGVLNTAVGVGGLLAATAALALVGRARLAGPVETGLLLYGLPLAIAGIAGLPAIAFLAFVASGAGRSLLDVAGRTLLQRVTPDASLARVFGLLEGLHQGMVAVGAVAVPILIGILGAREAFIAAGLWVAILLAVLWRALRTADDSAVVHVRELELLRRNPVFAPLAPPTVEWLAANLRPSHVAAGTWIIRAGDPGDAYHIVDRGRVEVHVDGRIVREEGPGEGFGEIALLRNVPRTASVRAATDVELLSLDRDAFLAAVAGHPSSGSAAEQVARERLGSG